MKHRLFVLMILTAFCSLPAASWAQTATDGSMITGSSLGTTGNPYQLLQKHWLVSGKVMNLQGEPLAGVKVWVLPLVSGESRQLTTDEQGQFITEYTLSADLVKEFSVVVNVNKKGFQKAHALVDFGSADKTWAIPITLRTPNQDPELLSQDDMVAALAARLKNPGPADGLTSKSEKDYAHGVEQFIDLNRPDRALASFNKVVDRDQGCVACRTMLGLAELASGDWDGATRNFGRGVDDIRNAGKTEPGQTKDAAKIPPGARRPEPLVAYGVMESWRHQEDRAAGFFQEALTIAPNDGLALQELGRMELFMHNWGEADNYLSKAVAAPGALPEAHFLHSQALLNEGQFDSATQEMNSYLNGRDVKTMPLEVRQVWARIQERKKIDVEYVKGKEKSKGKSKVATIDYLHRPVPELKGLVATKDQAPLSPILASVGKNVQVYFKNFPNTVSLEMIHQEKITRRGKERGTLDQQFHYLCLMPEEETEPGFNEYRANMSGESGQPKGLTDGYMLTSGFASASLIFHPQYQSESNFKYLGEQTIDGRKTYVIAYAQRPEVARLHGLFKMGTNSMPTFSQGLAWVDSENYEIVRLRSDLLKPLPEVRLDQQTTEIDFGENHFKSIAEGFWLPRDVTVSVTWNGKSLRNKHEYSDFKLFNVGASEKIAKPKEVEANSKGQDSNTTPN
jgi:tetratricopeptide (TPR) repeat protein